MDIHVSSAGPLHRWAIAARAFYRTSIRRCAALSGAARRMTTLPGASVTRQSAQADALASLSVIYARKCRLMIQREILSAERKEAIRLHSKVSRSDARLKEITNELLSIG